MVASMDMPPQARAVPVGRGHRFAAYPRCSTDSMESGVTGDIVELAAERPAQVAPRLGYHGWSEECHKCHRGFIVYVPSGAPRAGVFTRDIPCPHCHAGRVEVLAQRSSAPILVVPTKRSFVAWWTRRVGRAADERYRTVRAYAIALVLAVRKLVSSSRR